MAWRSKIHQQTVTVDVDVDVSEVLDEISTEQIVEILKERGLDAAKHDPSEHFRDLLEEAAGRLRDGEPFEALLLIERILKPKWPTSAACLADFAKARKAMSQ